jgi:NAD(P)H-hydrate epimerase
MGHEILTAEHIASLITPRPRNSNKGSYGHVLVLAGSKGMSGAAALCANAALRGGAGLVTAGMPESIEPLVTGRLRPEAMTLPLPEGKYRSLCPDALPAVLETVRVRRISTLVIGPGLGNNDDTRALVHELVQSVAIPLVIDADALNVLAGADTAAAFVAAKTGIIITPHPGELSRLSGSSIEAIQADRLAAARAAALQFGVTCVLKGHETVIASGDALFVNPTGNPGMATGGTGDVLAGMIAALVAQVSDPRPLHAALAGVYLHGLAGDIAAQDRTEIGLVAGDLIDCIPAAVRQLPLRTR